MKLDQAQRRILAQLQQDSSISTQNLAEKVGLSPSPCWRRVREMEEAGLIRGYVALLDRHKLGLGTCVWVRVKLKKHGADVLDRFENVVKGCNEVVECYELLGETDCLLKLYLPNLEAFSTFMHDFLLKLPEVDVTHSSVALREIKNETALPL
ncbi:MAG: Lrp/AsnC family transcriptional regulator [Aromatoleum sp.]|jgi:DNA-binding Lrp family transcriptional regulator|uniref:Lrp/AsnC family transcriptional regulator n=1 Tax=Aromatoleum sp. TaxID=2307007 RepID=UPI002893D288|nr:Lrp/AsnC family transcriptional regulator [Aromatoleum sp.]MDT3670629.1 Lrp/AsnC family transcriptional regulator [Aromatoleum sp.]